MEAMISSPGPHFSSGYLSISWINVVLYTLEITLATYYFSRFKTDRSLQLLLFSLLLADTICTITVLASSWMLLINSYKNYSLSESRWTVPLSTFMLTSVAVIEELYLLNRCRRLFQSPFILAALFSMVLAHAILEFYSGIYVAAFPAIYADARRYGNRAAAISASIASTVDIFIPLALICQIHAVTPLQISRQRSWRDTIVNTISSGGCGAVMSIVLVVLFWTRTDVFYILVNTMGRVYIITIFVNLIVSKSRSSPYDVPDAAKTRRKLSFGANLKLYNFTKPAASIPLSQILDKTLPPTPQEARFNPHYAFEENQSSPSLAPHIVV